MLYAESLMDLQPWDYWEAVGTTAKGRTDEIVGLLEKTLEQTLDHLGAIHYYIHLTEASSDPKRAVPHAQRLGRLMPGAGHVVHMPFHTFFRVGMYKEAVEANRQAVLVDEAYIARSTPIGIYPQGGSGANRAASKGAELSKCSSHCAQSTAFQAAAALVFSMCSVLRLNCLFRMPVIDSQSHPYQPKACTGEGSPYRFFVWRARSHRECERKEMIDTDDELSVTRQADCCRSLTPTCTTCRARCR
ncbi:MAG: hypothetical protein ABI612_25110, partial [Betaproteobacteria bacterium]